MVKCHGQARWYRRITLLITTLGNNFVACTSVDGSVVVSGSMLVAVVGVGAVAGVVVGVASAGRVVEGIHGVAITLAIGRRQEQGLALARAAAGRRAWGVRREGREGRAK